MGQDTISSVERVALPLTICSEEEELFRSTVRQFAEEKIRSLVMKMDRDAKMEPALIRELFELGLMGVGVPESYGGSGGTFFMAVQMVEELSRVDASVGVLADVQNTLVNNAIMRWGTEEQRKKFLPRLCKDTLGAYALSEAGSGSDAFALSARANETTGGYLLTGRKLWITNAAEAGVFIVFANASPEKGYKGIT